MYAESYRNAPHFQWLRGMDPNLITETNFNEGWYLPRVDVYKSMVQNDDEDIITEFYNKAGFMGDWDDLDLEETTIEEAIQKTLDVLNWYWTHEP